MPSSCGLHEWQVVAGAAHVGLDLTDRNRENAQAAAQISQGFVGAEVKFCR